jgi:hypothetical protein
LLEFFYKLGPRQAVAIPEKLFTQGHPNLDTAGKNLEIISLYLNDYCGLKDMGEGADSESSKANFTRLRIKG